MNKTNIYRIIVIVIVTGLFTFTGCHHRSVRWHRSEKNVERITGHIVKKLNLNEEQRNKLYATINGLMVEKEKILRDSSLKNEIFFQLGNDKIDELYLSSIVSEYTKEMEELMKNFVSNLIVFHNTLTPEQKKLLSKLLNEHKDRNWKHHRTCSRR
jgi:Spy/CpxP family protein refolding chaperone